jgi:hypothetical protein
MECHIPAQLRTTIREAYALVCQLPEDANPMRSRIPCVILTGHDNQMHSDDLFESDDNNAAFEEIEQHAIGNGAPIHNLFFFLSFLLHN